MLIGGYADEDDGLVAIAAAAGGSAVFDFAFGEPNENAPEVFGGRAAAVLGEPNENPDDAAGAGAPAVAFGDPNESGDGLAFAFGDTNEKPDFVAAEVPFGEPNEKLPEVAIGGGAVTAIALAPAPNRFFGSPPGFLAAAAAATSPPTTDGAPVLVGGSANDEGGAFASAVAVVAATTGTTGFVVAVAVPNTDGAAELVGGWLANDPNPPPAVVFDAKLPKEAAPAVVLAPTGAKLPNPGAAAVPSGAGGDANVPNGEEEEAPKADVVVVAPNPPLNTPPPPPASFLSAGVGSTSDPGPKLTEPALPLPNTGLFGRGGVEAGTGACRRWGWG